MRKYLLKLFNRSIKSLGLKVIFIEPDFEWNGKTLYLPLTVDYRNHYLVDKFGTTLDIEFKNEEDLRFICMVINIAGS